MSSSCVFFPRFLSLMAYFPVVCSGKTKEKPSNIDRKFSCVCFVQDDVFPAYPAHIVYIEEYYILCYTLNSKTGHMGRTLIGDCIFLIYHLRREIT